MTWREWSRQNLVERTSSEEERRGAVQSIPCAHGLYPGAECHLCGVRGIGGNGQKTPKLGNRGHWKGGGILEEKEQERVSLKMWPTFLSDPWTTYVWTRLSRAVKGKISELSLEPSPRNRICNSGTDKVSACFKRNNNHERKITASITSTI